jgi:hypothetical protein
MKSGNNYPLDMEGGGQPLQLRRDSDAQARKSLLDKYTGDINDNDGVTYNNEGDLRAKKRGVAEGNESSMMHLDEDIKNTRSRRIKIALIVGAVLLVVITLVLIFTLHKKHHDPIKPDE